MGIRKIDLTLCNRCGICVDICSMDVLREHEDRTPYIAYLADCMSCFICEMECPVEAIYVSPARERRIPLSW
jgi:NAD-dependent dihydropyrimidine dehydrogenase PreA subunit